MYHSITLNNNEEGYLDPFSVDQKNFERQILILKNDKRVNFVHFNQPHIDYNKTNIAITFDDGYLDNLTLAAPFLEKNLIPFTIFITSDNLESPDRAYMKKDDLKKLANFKFCQIGSHGKTHQKLAELNQEEVKIELQDSKKILEENSQKVVNSLSFPHGSYDLNFFPLLKSTGYLFALTSVLKFNKKYTSPLQLSRVVIMRRDNDEMFKNKYQGFFDWYSYVQILKGRP